jgi:hypothetical protein
MNTLLLVGVGVLLVWSWAKRQPRQADRVSEDWLKSLKESEGLDFEPESRPAMRLIKTEAQSAPRAYVRPVGE